MSINTVLVNHYMTHFSIFYVTMYKAKTTI